MSANNWRQCPKCRKSATLEHKKAHEELETLYGKVPREQYMEMHQEVNKLVKNTALDDTLREDWEIGIFKGEFVVIYNASCSICGFGYSYHHKERVQS